MFFTPSFFTPSLYNGLFRKKPLLKHYTNYDYAAQSEMEVMAEGNLMFTTFKDGPTREGSLFNLPYHSQSYWNSIAYMAV